MLASLLTYHRPTRLFLTVFEIFRLVLLSLVGPFSVIHYPDSHLSSHLNVDYVQDVNLLIFQVLLLVTTISLFFDLFYIWYDRLEIVEPGFFDFLWEDETLGGIKIKKQDDENKKQEEESEGKEKKD
eukprot:TRINITY_DN2110_c0_g1_i2.p2 TRINITY_DN2110_c0_g1~~TRINITY_DN2110_c0_g1_i2.p2  ORF type:complete len:127 (-),score=23.81 TRINITY_DN2110_c0_g1_i2:568-948(-)